MGIVYTIIIGAICGYIADALMKNNGYGLVINIIIGIAGSYIGGWAFAQLGLTINVCHTILNQIIIGAVGAIIILFILGVIRGGRNQFLRFACMEVPCVVTKALLACYKKISNVTVNLYIKNIFFFTFGC